MNRKPILKRRKGMTGLETAIILVAFVITAAAFAFVVLNMGFLTAQKSQTVISAGMEEATSSLQVDGDIVATFNTTAGNMTECAFYLRLSQGKNPVDLSANKLVMTYTNPRESGVIYDGSTNNCVTKNWKNNDTDSLLESGERVEIVVNFTAVTELADFSSDAFTQEYEEFRLTIRPAQGSVLTLERDVPAINKEKMILE